MIKEQIENTDETTIVEKWRKSELTTIALYASICLSWFGLTYFHEFIALPFLYVFGAITICLFGSYQHEAVHNHPTSSKKVNYWLAWPPLHLWIPFEAYLHSHLAHHRCEHLSDPYDDPESYYWFENDWQQIPSWKQKIYRMNNTAAGRFVIGPFISIGRFLKLELKDIAKGDTEKLRYWLIHLVGCAAVLYWLVVICEMPLWQYLLCFVYGGTSLSLMRSYMEHKPAPNWAERTLIVEGSWFSQLIFLNNNFHVLHHEKPEIPWYQLKPVYFQQKQRILRDNNHYFYRSYWQLIKEHMFKPKDEPVYPYPHIDQDKRL